MYETKDRKRMLPHIIIPSISSLNLKTTCQINLSNVTFGWHQRSQLVICKSHPSKTADGCNVQLILRNRSGKITKVNWATDNSSSCATKGDENLWPRKTARSLASNTGPINAFLDTVALGMFNFWLWILNYFKSSLLTYLDWKQIFLKPRGNSASIFFPTFFLRLLSVYGELNSCFIEISARKCYKPRWTEWRRQLRKLFNVDF